MTAAQSPGAEALEWDRALPDRAHLLQTFEWGDVQSRFGWKVERPVLDIGGQKLPVSVLTAPTATPGGRHGYVPKGPAVGREAMPEAFAAIGEWAGESGLAYVRVEPDLEAPFTAPHGWHPDKPTQPEHTSVLDLAVEPAALLAGFKSKTRYNIRLAERRGVRVERSTDIAAFATMARETSARHGIQLAEAPYYRAVLELLEPADMARLYLARADEEVLAGIVVTRFGGRATYLFGASARAHRELMPAYLLHWRAIQDLHSLGDIEYDLWGVPPDDKPGHPLSGLWQFKSGWNGRMVKFAGAYVKVSNVTMWRADQAVAKIRGNVRRVRSRWRR